MKKFKVSKREAQIMSLLIKGVKHSEIAKQLDLNAKTISTYMLRLKKKLGLNNDANLYLFVKTYLAKLGKLEQVELHSDYYMYGNKGSCWTDTIHVAKSGQSTTLCGSPMLATNWARIWEHTTIGCPDCIAKYRREVKIPKQ